MRATVSVVIFAGAWLVTRPAASEDSGKPKDCPMHSAHQPRDQASASDHQAAVDLRHEHASGVAHADSVHHFVLVPQGGRISLEVADGADIAGRDGIRAHLRQVAREFRQGHFGLPMMVHGRTPPGVEVMRRLKEAIRYRYEPTDRGGRVVITTENREARTAIHDFLRFQIEDHRTGDPIAISAFRGRRGRRPVGDR